MKRKSRTSSQGLESGVKKQDSTTDPSNKKKRSVSGDGCSSITAHSGLDVDSLKSLMKLKYPFDLSEDFFALWEFAVSINKSKPEDAFSVFGLKLVGPYVLLTKFCSSNDEERKSLDNLNKDSFLLAWRYYFDIPEFQTVIANTITSFHIGYFRDDPNELPSLVCSNKLEDGGKFTTLGDNVLGALHFHLTKAAHSLKSTKKSNATHIIKELEDFTRRHEFCLDPNTSDKIRLRKKRTVGQVFHGLGIVVPVVNSVGYRCIGQAPGTLKKWLKTIDTSSEQSVIDEHLDKIYELISNIQLANDECDFGAGLELGLDMFCSGCKIVHKQINQVLTMAYTLLNRPLYAKILEMHLQARKPEPTPFD